MEVALADLWLPIVVSAVLVFLASSVFHMMLPIHKGDYKKLPNEDKVLQALRDQGVTPQTYMFPNCPDMKELGSPEMLAKFKQGPVGWMTVLPPGPPAMGKALAGWFILTLVISLLVAYVLTLAGLPRGVEYMKVFRLASTVGVIAYALGVVNESIWKGQKWSVTFKFIFDGVVYGLVTAGTFAWLWPDAG
jgi:hypothetical protein